MSSTDPFETDFVEGHNTDKRPLEGRTVMITRAKAQAVEMAARLEKLGAKVIHCPTIEVSGPSSWDSADAAIEKLESFDWIIFTSANSPRFFLGRLKEIKGAALEIASKAIICAIGPATAKAVEEFGVRVNLTATDSRAEGALEAIINEAGGRENIAGLRFLIPRARIARDVLPVELSRLGAEVADVEVYQTIKPDFDQQTIITLFKQRQVHAITFTSPSTVKNFASLLSPETVSELLAETVVACIGPVTSAAAIELRLKNIVQPEVYNSEALVQAIVEAIGNS